MDRELDRDDVAEHVDPGQFPVNVGQQLAQPDDQIAQSLTLAALLAFHSADAAEHAVLGEQVDEPLGVENIALGEVVRARTSASVSDVTVDLPQGRESSRRECHAAGSV